MSGRSERKCDQKIAAKIAAQASSSIAAWGQVRRLRGFDGAAVGTGENQRGRYACLVSALEHPPQLVSAFAGEGALRIGCAGTSVLGDTVA